jgi:hypothetical protein
MFAAKRRKTVESLRQEFKAAFPECESEITDGMASLLLDRWRQNEKKVNELIQIRGKLLEKSHRFKTYSNVCRSTNQPTIIANMGGDEWEIELAQTQKALVEELRCMISITVSGKLGIRLSNMYEEEPIYKLAQMIDRAKSVR